MIDDRFAARRREQIRLVPNEQEIRDNFNQAIGYEVSEGWHTETCPDGCDDGSIMIRKGFLGSEVRWVECWTCQGEGEVTVRDDPRWGWALEMELGGDAA